MITLLPKTTDSAKDNKESQAENKTKEQKDDSAPVFHRGAKHHKLG